MPGISKIGPRRGSNRAPGGQIWTREGWPCCTLLHELGMLAAGRPRMARIEPNLASQSLFQPGIARIWPRMTSWNPDLASGWSHLGSKCIICQAAGIRSGSAGLSWPPVYLPPRLTVVEASTKGTCRACRKGRKEATFRSISEPCPRSLSGTRLIETVRKLARKCSQKRVEKWSF